MNLSILKISYINFDESTVLLIFGKVYARVL